MSVGVHRPRTRFLVHNIGSHRSRPPCHLRPSWHRMVTSRVLALSHSKLGTDRLRGLLYMVSPCCNNCWPSLTHFNLLKMVKKDTQGQGTKMILPMAMLYILLLHVVFLSVAIVVAGVAGMQLPWDHTGGLALVFSTWNREVSRFRWFNQFQPANR